jgi:DNA-binding MarR family transcriptional regulator
MTYLEKLNNKNKECAGLLLETVPAVMRTIRAEMRRQKPADLSVLQFRTLNFINRQPGTTMSALTQHIGLTMATVSRMAEGLVERGLVERRTAPDDRRKVTLWLTESGQATLKASHRATEVYLSQLLRPLNETELALVAEALQLLQPLFATTADRFEEHLEDDAVR